MSTSFPSSPPSSLLSFPSPVARIAMGLWGCDSRAVVPRRVVSDLEECIWLMLVAHGVMLSLTLLPPMLPHAVLTLVLILSSRSFFPTTLVYLLFHRETLPLPLLLHLSLPRPPHSMRWQLDPSPSFPVSSLSRRVLAPFPHFWWIHTAYI